MKTRTILIIAFLFISQAFFAQNTYLVYLKDKNNSPFSVDQPEKFLSEKAIQRRSKFNIPISDNDLPVTPHYIAALSQFGLKVHHKSKWLNAVGIICRAKHIDAVRGLAFVKDIVPIKTKAKKNDIRSSFLRNDDFSKYTNTEIYGKTRVQNELVKVPELHRRGFTGKGVHIAIMDGGFYQVDDLEAFEKVRQENRIIDKFDFVDNDTEVYDLGYHGMRVLSSIAGEIDFEYVGCAPHASFSLYRTEDSDSESKLEELNWVAAVERADSVGVDVVSSSLGYHDFDDDSMDYTHNDLDGRTAISSRAAEIAASKGMLIIISAGNSGDDDWEKITPPADARDILAVGATTFTGEIASFSSIGNTADGRVKPDVTAMGVSVALQAPKGGFDESNGTSYAAPIVAGSVACLRQAFPGVRNTDILNAVRIGSQDYFEPTQFAGYGLVNCDGAYAILEGLRKLQLGELFLYPKLLSEKSIVFDNATTGADIISVDIFSSCGKGQKTEVSLYEQSGNKIIENSGLLPGVYQLKLNNTNNQITRGHFVVLP